MYNKERTPIAILESGKTASIGIREQKCTDPVAEELRRLITQRSLEPGDKLPRGIRLQETLGVSKGTIREALRSLKVQGLVSMSTGSAGGGIIIEVSLDRTLQLTQNYLFFKDVGTVSVYAVHCLFKSGLAVGAVLHLAEDDFRALEHIIDPCDPVLTKAAAPLDQRQEDLSFHDILAAANPDSMLRFCCELINEMIWQLVVFGNETSPKDHAKFGVSNMKFHRQILDAARARDAGTVCILMSTHVDDCMYHVTRMKNRVHGRFVFGSEMPCRHRLLIGDHDDSGHSDHSEDHV